MDNIRFKGLWIPAEICNMEINGIDKMFLCMIYNFSDNSDKGICFASNKYIAKLLGTSIRKVQILIKKYEKLGYIETIYINNYDRRIKSNMVFTVLEKDSMHDLHVGMQNIHGGMHDLHGGYESCAPYNKDDNIDIEKNIEKEPPKKQRFNKHIIQANTLEEAQEIWNIKNPNIRAYIMPYKGGGYFPVTREYLGEDFFTIFSHKDIPTELKKAQAWLITNTDRQRTNLKRFLGNWMKNNWS
jgi:DNA-binding Lrp family transcriptional regulator